MPARPPVSASLTELIAVRMTGLSDAERRALELLAFGEPLRVASWLADRRRAGGGNRGARAREPRRRVTERAGDSPIRSTGRRSGSTAGVSASGPAGPRRHRRGTWRSRRRLAARRALAAGGRRTDSQPLLEAAAAANLAGDPQLGRRALAALDTGRGLRASLLLARAHTIQSEYEQAAAVLAAAEPDIESEADAVDYLEQQAAVLYFGLGRSEELHGLLDRAHAWWAPRSGTTV